MTIPVSVSDEESSTPPVDMTRRGDDYNATSTTTPADEGRVASHHTASSTSPMTDIELEDEGNRQAFVEQQHSTASADNSNNDLLRSTTGQAAAAAAEAPTVGSREEQTGGVVYEESDPAGLSMNNNNNNNTPYWGASHGPVAATGVATNNNGDDGGFDDEDEDMVQRWRASVFAVGLTKPTWKDEPLSWNRFVTDLSPVTITACLCRKAGRVGNMVVLFQQHHRHHHDEHVLPNNNAPAGTPARQQRQRPRIICVVGPYWMVLSCLTIPIFVAVSYWAYTRILQHSIVIIIVWALLTFGLFASLFMVSCRDPGILYRHPTPPAPDWLWNDQALTFRPKHAKYDSDCGVVIEKFDHTCPWTGTAIGKRNMLYFRLFLFFLPACLMFDVVVLTLLT